MQRDPFAAGSGLDGILDEVLEDEKDEVGGAIGERSLGLVAGDELNIGLASGGGCLGLNDVDEIIEGDLAIDEGLFVLEDADDFIDERLHLAGGIGGGLPGAIGPGAILFGALLGEIFQAEEGVFKAMNEMGGHGAQGGGFGRENEFTIGALEFRGSQREQFVGALEPAERLVQPEENEAAAGQENSGAMAEEIEVELGELLGNGFCGNDELRRAEEFRGLLEMQGDGDLEQGDRRVLGRCRGSSEDMVDVSFGMEFADRIELDKTSQLGWRKLRGPGIRRERHVESAVAIKKAGGYDPPQTGRFQNQFPLGGGVIETAEERVLGSEFVLLEESDRVENFAIAADNLIPNSLAEMVAENPDGSGENGQG